MKYILSLAIAAVMLCVAAAAFAETSLFALNVGKADCLLLRSGDSVYLVDTGTKETADKVLATLEDLSVTHLDGVIVTHTDKDHSGGAKALAQSSLTIDHWYASGYYTGVTMSKHPAVKAANKRNQEVEWILSGAVLPIDNGTMTVLGPISSDDENENNNSLVLLVETADGSMLLTGDMEKAEESTLIDAGLIHQVDVLKVAHHGGADATSADLVNLLRPSVAVISTSTAEKSKTPSAKVLSRLKAVGAQIYVTQNAETGILVTMNQGNITVESK